MPKYLVRNPEPTNGRKVVKGLVVNAVDETMAKQLAASYTDDSTWIGATVTADDLTTNGFGNGLEGYVYRIQVGRKTGDLQAGPLVDVSVTGGSSWGLEEMGLALRNALNARPQIAGSTFALGTPGGEDNVLKVAETTDNLGDRSLSLRVYLPGGKEPVASMTGTIVDSGVAAAVLSVNLTYPTSNYPQIGFTV